MSLYDVSLQIKVDLNPHIVYYNSNIHCAMFISRILNIPCTRYIDNIVGKRVLYINTPPQCPKSEHGILDCTTMKYTKVNL